MPRRLTENSNNENRRRKSVAQTPRSRRGAVNTDAKKEAPISKSKQTTDLNKPVPRKATKGKHAQKKADTNILKAKVKSNIELTDNSKAPDESSPKAKERNSYTGLKTHSRASHAKSTAEKPQKPKEEKSAKEKAGKNKVSAEIRNNFIKLGIMIAIGVGIIIGIYYGIQFILERQSGFASVEKDEVLTPIVTQIPRERNAQEATEAEGTQITPNPAVIRDISYGARDIQFKERQINIPGIYDNELLFSAGTGSLYVGGNVLSKLYLYNLDADDETLIAEIDEKEIYAGEFYETLVNHRWLVWLETDHGTKNYIMVMNRSTGKVSKMQSFKEGQPKLKLYGDLLVWVEQVSDTEDRLSMIDLEVQEFLPIHTFSDKATYGVSSPCVYENTIVWSDRDPTQTEEDKAANGEKSAIFYLSLETDESGSFSDPKYYRPDTYVHEPLYNGDVFVWLDANKSPQSNLYIGRADEAPKKIATGVTTYSIGEGIVVYGKDQAVWVYVIATEELCRLTSPGEMGMLPAVTERTVVWYNLSADSDKDVLRFIVLTDEELYPGGLS